MELRYLLSICVTWIACATAVPASAVPLLFDFSGPSGTALFQLDSNPAPDFSQTFIGSDHFSFANVAGTYGGTPGIASTISFGNGIFASLSIDAPNLGFTQFNSPTLFSGSPSSPVFLTGSFTLVNPFFGNGELTISPIITAAVPGPIVGAGLPGLILGLAGIGFIAYRRRRSQNLSLHAA